MIRGTVAAVLVLLVVGACSGDDASDGPALDASTAPDVTICDPDGEPQSDDELPAVGTIAAAMDALEDELGAPAEYFEVNATARVVNLFVALNDASVVQPWVYVDGELSAEDGQPASGGTFATDDVGFDADTVLEGVRAELPDAIVESFYVHGDGAGNLQYGVLVSTQCGGGFDVVVGADGTVQSVDPV